MSKIRRVLVVGGGVGGLTAATAFARRGVDVVLIERRPAFDVPGVGLGHLGDDPDGPAGRQRLEDLADGGQRRLVAGQQEAGGIGVDGVAATRAGQR